MNVVIIIIVIIIWIIYVDIKYNDILCNNIILYVVKYTINTDGCYNES